MGNSLTLREEDLLWQEIDDELVILDLRSSTYFRLNGTGAVLWKLLGSPTTKEDLSDALVSRYGIEETRARNDVNAFVDSLTKKKLLS